MKTIRRILGACLGLVLSAGVAVAQDKVVISAPTKTVSFAPIYLPVDTGGYKKRNLDVDIVVLTGGMPAISAVLGGNAQFTVVANDELLKLADSGKLIRVHNFVNSFTQNFQVRNQIIEERGISLQEPWRERIKKLKGIRVGVLGLGGSSDLSGRWLFKEAGLDPETDMKIIRIGAMPSLLASLKQGTADAFMLSAPAGPIIEAQGTGKMVVRWHEVEEWRNEAFLGIDTRRDYIAANRSVVKRMVEAIAEAQAQIHKNPVSAAAILAKGSFTGTEPNLLEASLVSMRESYRPRKMMVADWQLVQRTRLTLGSGEGANVMVKEGELFTNEFFPE
jgi:NitT/TauT family transport system substrate-binding protein